MPDFHHLVHPSRARTRDRCADTQKESLTTHSTGPSVSPRRRCAKEAIVIALHQINRGACAARGHFMVSGIFVPAWFAGGCMGRFACGFACENSAAEDVGEEHARRP